MNSVQASNDFGKSLSKNVQISYPKDCEIEVLDRDFEVLSSDLGTRGSVCSTTLLKLRIAISNFWEKLLYRKITAPNTVISV